MFANVSSLMLDMMIAALICGISDKHYIQVINIHLNNKIPTSHKQKDPIKI